MIPTTAGPIVIGDAGTTPSRGVSVSDPRACCHARRKRDLSFTRNLRLATRRRHLVDFIATRLILVWPKKGAVHLCALP